MSWRDDEGGVDLEEAGLTCGGQSLGTVVGVQLAVDVHHVATHGVESNVELVADLGVGEALREQTQDLHLALGEGIQKGSQLEFAGCLWSCAGEGAKDPLDVGQRHPLSESWTTAQTMPDGPQQFPHHIAAVDVGADQSLGLSQL